MHTVDSLIAFRERVVQAFRDKQIRSPMHLNSDGQAAPLIEIFRDFRPGTDHLFSNWRSAWHCLLAGMPEEELFRRILDGQSMFICSREHRIICSSIVGGVLPIACGVAMAEKMKPKPAYAMPWIDDPEARRQMEPPEVWVCAGDMTGSTGLFHEFKKLCECRDLPVRVILEDNWLSTDTNTQIAWGREQGKLRVIEYRYIRDTPHVGIGERIEF